MYKNRGFFALILASLGYGINDVFINILGQAFTTYQQVLFRTFISLLVIFLCSFFIKFKITLKDISKKYLVFYGFSFPLVILFFVSGIIYSKVASVLFAFYASSFFFSLLIGVIIFKERITKIKIISLFLVILGLYLFTYPFSLQNSNLGFLFGTLAGIFSIITNSFSKHLGKHISPFVLTTTQMGGASVISLGLLLFFKQPIIPHASISIFILAVISSLILVVSTFLIVFGFKHIDLHLGTIIISLELFFGPLFAFIILSQSISFFELLGGLILITAITLTHVRFKR
jgi:drug/metabolite transporter (DMT)-like permease